MRKLVLILAIAAVFAWSRGYFDNGGLATLDALGELPVLGETITASAGDAELERAYQQRRSNFQVRGEGRVQRLLADDNDGSRHQRFILALGTGQTLLVAHNIDLAPRIAGLAPGDRVGFFGEYEWNDEGGVIHWTHHDPDGRHVGGWLEHEGRRYQ